MTLYKVLWQLLDVADKYYYVAAPVFLIFYVLLKKRIAYKKIQPKFPAMKDYVREILYSTLSIVIFSIPPLLLLQSDTVRPHTTFYTDINEYGKLYFVLALPLMMLMHDTYFYWTHRFSSFSIWCTTGPPIHRPGLPTLFIRWKQLLNPSYL